MTSVHPARPVPDPGVITAGPADADALSDLIAEAFLHLPPSRWLIGDPAARRAIFPSCFPIYVEHALAFDATLDRHHPAGMAHHHLALLAVHPDHQGPPTKATSSSLT